MIENTTILFIKNTLENTGEVSDFLQEAGYSILSIETSKLFISNLENTSPDLMLYDLDNCENDLGIFKDYRFSIKKNIPIVFIFSNDNAKKFIREIQSEWIDILEKPINFNELLSRIRIQLELKLLRGRLSSIDINFETTSNEKRIELEKVNSLLRASDERWQFALEGSGDGVWDWNLATNEVYFSKRWKEMLGYTDKDMWDTYEEWTKHIHPEDVGWVTDSIQLHLYGDTPGYKSEHRVICKDGSYIWVLSQGKVITNDEGKPSRMVGTHTDISQRKENEKNLQKAKNEAEVANRLKSEFLANMSHEIRTPINAILGFSEILKDKLADNADILEYLLGIQKSGKNLINLINDILDIAKIEAGRLEFTYSPVNMLNVIGDIKQIFSIQTARKNLKLIVNLDSNLPETILLDDLRLRQILFNLIGNSLKFTEKGGVTINVHCSKNVPDSKYINLYLEVSDTGIGIPEKEIITVFEPFKQTHGQNASIYGGTGLGLSIVKRLVEMMNGSISLESQVGKGTKFTISLPNIELANNSISQKNDALFINRNTKFKKSKVLLVEDIESNRKVIEGYLQDSNLQIFEAYNGRIALEMLNEQNFDLILMDIQMPELDGASASIQIKQNEKHKEIPIIVITAYASKNDAIEFQTFAEGYLSKPMTKTTLIKEIAKFIPLEEYNENDTKKDIPEDFFALAQNLIAENKIPIEFIDKFILWYKNSEIARKSLNTNKLKICFLELKSLSTEYDLEIFNEFSDLQIKLINTFAISEISIQLSKLDEVYAQL